ncbi:MAG: hypothetical protein ACI819_001736, partial [Neolewinella sp.]
KTTGILLPNKSECSISWLNVFVQHSSAKTT